VLAVYLSNLIKYGTNHTMYCMNIWGKFLISAAPEMQQIQWYKGRNWEWIITVLVVCLWEFICYAYCRLPVFQQSFSPTKFCKLKHIYCWKNILSTNTHNVVQLNLTATAHCVLKITKPCTCIFMHNHNGMAFFSLVSQSLFP